MTSNSKVLQMRQSHNALARRMSSIVFNNKYFSLATILDIPPSPSKSDHDIP